MADFTGSSSDLFPGYTTFDETIVYDAGVSEAFSGELASLEGSGGFPDVEIFASPSLEAYDAGFEVAEGELVLTGSSSVLAPLFSAVEDVLVYLPDEMGFSGVLDTSIQGSLAPLIIEFCTPEDVESYIISVDSAFSGILGALGVGFIYRMRGFDTTLDIDVYWNADVIDSSAAQYDGPGPVVEIVVSKILGS